MTGLLLAEARRFLSRRSFRVIGVLAVVAVIGAGVLVFVESSKSLSASLPQAKQMVTECHQAIGSGPTARIRNGGLTVRDVASCPTIRQAEILFDKRFHYTDTTKSTTQNVAFPLFFLAFAIAASFVGAEWATGMMTTTLTWEPRRGRVLLAKVIPALLILGAAVIVLFAFMAVVFIPIGVFRGITTGMTASFWGHLAGLWLRAALIAMFGASLGIGLATLARNTVAALGIGFVFVAILDPIFSHLWRGRFGPWLLMQNLQRAMRMPIEHVVGHAAFGNQVTMTVQSATRPAILLSIYAVGLLAAAYATFRARDVT